MAKVSSEFEFCPLTTMDITSVKIMGEGEYKWIRYIVDKCLLKNNWYKIRIEIEEKR